MSRLVVVVAVVCLFGCGPQSADRSPEPSPSVGGVEATLPPGPATESPGALPTPRFATRQGPIERSCPDPFAPACVDGYMRLAELLQPGVDDWPARDAATLAALRELRHPEPGSASGGAWAAEWADVPDGITEEQLASELRRRLGFDALLGGGEVEVRLREGDGGGAEEEARFRRFELALRHPRLGGFDAAVRLPSVDGPVPLVLVLPGHISGDGFVDDVWTGLAGERMAAEGIGLVIARPRGADAEAVESAAAVRLLSAGHSLIGAHAAEAWLLAGAIEHLRAEGSLPPGRTGLLGHSSGALVGNVLCRLSASVERPPLAACVNDLYGDYFKLLCSGERCWVLDETDPRLRGLRHPLSALAGLPTLSPRPPYGLAAEDGSDREVERALEFFGARLR